MLPVLPVVNRICVLQYDGIGNLIDALGAIIATVVIIIVVVIIGTIAITRSANSKNRKAIRENKELQILPNSTLILVFGILSIVALCCYGIIGLILGVIAIILANKATKLYFENPEGYTGFQNVKTGKILAIIGVFLNGIFILSGFYMFLTNG